MRQWVNSLGAYIADDEFGCERKRLDEKKNLPRPASQNTETRCTVARAPRQCACELRILRLAPDLELSRFRHGSIGVRSGRLSHTKLNSIWANLGRQLGVNCKAGCGGVSSE